MKKILLFFIVLIACYTNYAQPSNKGKRYYERGIEYFEEKDSINAVKYIKKAALANDTTSQFLMGVFYNNGWGVKQDYSQASYWFKKFAENVEGDDRLFLGKLYMYNKYIEPDYIEAAYWLSQPAIEGNTDAQALLGLCFERNFEKKRAAYWYQKAAECDSNVVAQYRLGDLYYWGIEEKPDYEQALCWYKKAAEQGSYNAQYMLGRMYENGIGVEQDVDKAVYWYQKAAEQDLVRAYLELGKIYEDMGDSAINYEKSFKWYKKAAEKGIPLAYDKLSLMYAKGKGVTQDIEKARYWRAKSDSLSNRSYYLSTDSTCVKDPYWNLDAVETLLKQDVEKRIALVIGMSDYDERLMQAEKDATDLSNLLKTLGFEVTRCINKGHDEMEKIIVEFCDNAEKYDVAMIYYAGHAVQEDGVNYLVPAHPDNPLNVPDLRRKYVELSWMLESLQYAKVRKNIVILDACHNRPDFVFTTSKSKKGLAPIDEMRNFLIALPCLPGEVEKEDDRNENENSLYMKVLLEELQNPIQDVDKIMIKVRDRVVEITEKEQTPFFKNNLNERKKNKFYFNRGK